MYRVTLLGSATLQVMMSGTILVAGALTTAGRGELEEGGSGRGRERENGGVEGGVEGGLETETMLRGPF